MTHHFRLRLPSNFGPDDTDFVAPANEWLEGTWYVTHSTLPLWHGRQNVTMNYTILPPDEEGVVHIDDISRYQHVGSSEVKEVHGIDKPNSTVPGAWDWRGKGLLKVAASPWEILGYGDVENDHQWCVTYFGKTIFTPAGIDVYSRKKEGLPESALEGIIQSLKAMEPTDLQDLIAKMYEIPRE